MKKTEVSFKMWYKLKAINHIIKSFTEGEI